MNTERWQKIKAVFSESARRYVPGTSLAVAYGAKDKAFAFLDKEFNDRASRPKFAFYYIWEDLRDDPRFTDFVRRV